MNRLLATLPILLFVGCAGGPPCQTSNECGATDTCVAAHCQALSCDATWYAVDPATGQCRPLPGCGNRDDVRGWKSCDNPCVNVDENHCIADSRCQPVYSSDQTQEQICEAAGGAPPLPPVGTKDVPNVPSCGGTRTFDGCRPNPVIVDPCQGLTDAACSADSRCVLEQLADDCACAAGQTCNCGNSTDCRMKTCFDYQTAADCAAHSECTSGNSGVCNCPNDGTLCDCAPPPGTDPPFEGCFPKGGGSCNGMDEPTCLTHPECHAVGTACYCPALTSCKCSGGSFSFCEPDDGLARCNSDSDCGGDQRCNNDEACAPPVGGGGFAIPTPAFPPGTPVPDDVAAPSLSCAGLCVPKGCTGYGEQSCNNDPTCQPIYILDCSPYGGGGVAPGPCGGGEDAANGQPISCGGCEPTFSGCVDATPGSVVDPARSVLLRDPTVVDDPAFAFPQVMSLLAKSADPAPFVERWLTQIAETQTIGGEVATARPGAKDFLSLAPRRKDGHLDLVQLGFQVTSLSNRIDLAGPHDCGEARVTYALGGGVTDRRHRMTIIVELGQPDDGAHCMAVAKKWIALSSLTGNDLVAAARAIYAPLLVPAHVNQVRTNEFLVGDQFDPNTGAPPPWELREWRFGADGDLHLANSKQAVDPTAAQSDAFTTWAQSNQAGILSGAAIVPDQFLAVTSSENGSRISVQPWGGVGHADIENALNKNACAGCHTTETNSAFTHVAERWQGTGRAEISEFLRQLLPQRSQNLFKVSLGQLSDTQRSAPRTVH